MFIAGIAKNERELFSRLISAMVGGSTVGRFTVSGTGNGTLHGLEVPHTLFGQTIVLTCTVAAANEAEFSVTVGGTGVISANTHKPYNYQGLNFMIGMGSTPWAVGDTITIAPDGASNLTDQEVYLETYLGSVEEDLTLECTNASVAGETAVFSVTGSVSGLLGAVTQGTRTELAGYTVIVPVGRDFAVGDSVTYPLRASELPTEQRWEILETVTDHFRFVSEEFGHEQIDQIALRGRGNTGTENIYIHLNRRGLIDRHVSWTFSGFTGWDDAIPKTTQQGWLDWDDQPSLTMQHELMSFFISIDGRRVMGVIGSGEVYSHFYLGFLQTHQAPSHYPYPLFIGGSCPYRMLDDDLAGDIGYYQKEVAVHSAYWNPTVDDSNYGQGVLYTFNDTWELIGSRDAQSTTSTGIDDYYYNANRRIVFPYGMDGMSRMRANFDGSYTPVPVWIGGVSSGMKSVTGRFDGLMAISSDNGQQALNILESGGAYHLVFHNVYRQGANDFCTVEVK